MQPKMKRKKKTLQIQKRMKDSGSRLMADGGTITVTVPTPKTNMSTDTGLTLMAGMLRIGTANGIKTKMAGGSSPVYGIRRMIGLG